MTNARAAKALTPSKQYERLLLTLHNLIAEGQGNTDVADDLREQMDQFWPAIDEKDRMILSGLSADLYMISGKEIRVPSDAIATELDVRRAELYKQRQWTEFLDLMRSGPTGPDS